MKLSYCLVVPLFLTITTLTSIQCSRILLLAPICFKSHKHSFMPIVEALAAKGHQLTVVTPFQPKTKVENVKEIVMPDFLSSKEMSVDWFNFQGKNPIMGVASLFKSFRTTQTAAYKSLMADEEFQRIVSNRDVDLVIVLAVLNDFTLPIIDYLGVPFIFYSATISVPWLMSSMNAAQDYAYVPAFGTDYISRMSFKERMKNMVVNELTLLLRPVGLFWTLDDMVRQDFPGVLPISEIERNAQLLLVNFHPSIGWNRPFPPTIIPIPAPHIRPIKPLPKNLESFIEGAADGFILFTLGSVIPVSSMPVHLVRLFVNVFSRLPQRIYWKWEINSVPEDQAIPNNVLMVDWLPQQDLLGHPKAKLFISHGGLLGIQEALYHAVPVLGLPFGNDQRSNLAKGQDEGYALKLDWAELSETLLYDTITELITKSNYKENATRNSRLMKDELMPAKEVAVYWVEHVLRHNGTKHLQSSGKNMPLYQHYLLDVWFVLLLVTMIVSWFTLKAVIFIIRKLRGNKKVKTN